VATGRVSLELTRDELEIVAGASAAACERAAAVRAATAVAAREGLVRYLNALAREARLRGHRSVSVQFGRHQVRLLRQDLARYGPAGKAVDARLAKLHFKKRKRSYSQRVLRNVAAQGREHRVRHVTGR
jgi:hypothetical protein